MVFIKHQMTQSLCVAPMEIGFSLLIRLACLLDLVFACVIALVARFYSAWLRACVIFGSRAMAEWWTRIMKNMNVAHTAKAQLSGAFMLCSFVKVEIRFSWDINATDSCLCLISFSWSFVMSLLGKAAGKFLFKLTRKTHFVYFKKCALYFPLLYHYTIGCIINWLRVLLLELGCKEIS